MWLATNEKSTTSKHFSKWALTSTPETMQGGRLYMRLVAMAIMKLYKNSRNLLVNLNKVIGPLGSQRQYKIRITLRE